MLTVLDAPAAAEILMEMMMKQQAKSRRIVKLTGRNFEAMTAGQREALAAQFERTTPEERWAAARAPTAREVEQGKRIARGLRGPGRPKLGKHGTRVVAVLVEAELLRQPDAYARKLGLKRAELFTRGLRAILPMAG